MPSPSLQDNSSCARDPAVRCAQCRLRGLCLPLSMSGGEIELLDSIIGRRPPVHAGDHVYRIDDEFVHVFVLRAGCVKTYACSDSGRELVTGFYLPGEMFGLDGMATNHYRGAAVALDTSTVCELPFDSLGELSQSIPILQTHVFEMMSRKIVQQQQLLVQLNRSSSTASQRIAALLLSLALRHRRLRLSPHDFRLAMSRTDIASYVGMTIETVSRTFRELSRRGICAVHNRDIGDLDLEALEQIVLQS